MKSSPAFDTSERARRHPIVCDKPAVDFFSGALLGNGGLGAVICTRPDAVMIHFGHNAVWDIRLAEKNRDRIGTFQEIFEKVKAIPRTCKKLEEDPWYAEYCKMARENYARPYPRPFPCGTVVLGFDRREAELLGHRLDISVGLCSVAFVYGGKRVALECFADLAADRLWLRMVDEAGRPTRAPFLRVNVLPDPETPKEFPPFTVPQSLPPGTLSFRQVTPSLEPDAYDAATGHPNDRAFRLTIRLNAALEKRSRINWSGATEEMSDTERAIPPAEDFFACIQVDHDLASQIPDELGNPPSPTPESYEAASRVARESWRSYWSKSGVALGDEFLERIWYWNLYFLNCSVREGVTCPGLFANWSYRNIGTAWHGDYHMNYNTQQPFWVTFSTNHIDKHLPYVDLVDHLLPVSRRWAREYYGLRGAYFPHTGYPVEMAMNPYPVPTWGWEICETPWTVQSLWWHYRYTMDRGFLEGRAFGSIKEAVLFLVDYMKRPEARGERWPDGKYHIFPTVPPELYGLRPGFDKNYDCLVDLTLTKFVFRAFLEACVTLEREEEQADLISDVREILEHFPDYPTATSKLGTIFVSVPGEDRDVVYNTPNNTMTVFPGEDHGLHSTKEEYEIAANSYRIQQNEGGNELVFLNLQAARLGLLDIERFKRQINYCLLPNGTCSDNVLQVHGRYWDTLAFDYMSKMGIWFENFALPVVLNECLLQSYNGTLRFFPNWPADKPAEFRTLRAVGAFLVSAAFEAGTVQWIEIFSEAGQNLRVIIPWKSGTLATRPSDETEIRVAIWETQTHAGETIRLTPIST